MLERKIEEYLVRQIKRIGGKAYKWSSPSNRAVPDRLCILPKGIIKLVELKATGKKPTALQKKVHREIRVMGHEVLVIDSKASVDILISILKEDLYGSKKRVND